MKTKSIWGKPPSRLYEFRNMILNKFGTEATVCIIGGSDGKFVLPFLRGTAIKNRASFEVTEEQFRKDDLAEWFR